MTGAVLLSDRDPDMLIACVACGHRASQDCDCPCGICPYCRVKDHGHGRAHRRSCIRWEDR